MEALELQAITTKGLSSNSFWRQRRAEELAKEASTFYTDRFHNADAIRAYMGIGRELVEQAGIGLATLCGGVGTVGMMVDVSRSLRKLPKLQNELG